MRSEDLGELTRFRVVQVAVPGLESRLDGLDERARHAVALTLPGSKPGSSGSIADTNDPGREQSASVH